MNIFTSKKLATITIVYWILLVYVIAALVWWFISLEKQNHQMTDFKLHQLIQTDQLYFSKAEKINEDSRRKNAQYIGEGITFFALIIIGALFVYRATRNQFRVSLQQQNFMMAITHELKTPIAVARLNLETLQKRKLDETQQQKLLFNTLQETNRLNSLCNNILLASQFDAGAYKVNLVKVNLSEVVSTSVKDFTTRFPNRIIESDIQDGIVISGEELLLQLLINNLIENALKYSPKNKPVKVSLQQPGKTIDLTVIDEGTGIVEKERKQIFEKFYRIGNESTRNAKGTGLGLYLCKKIAEDHHATIAITNNNNEGSIFTVSFKNY